MPNERFPRWQKRLLLFAALGLALTGMGQMPIFSRYYIADLPGLGWLGDYETTAALHLALAAVLLFVLGMFVAGWFGQGAGRPQLTAAGWQRAIDRSGMPGLRVTRIQHYRSLYERQQKY